MKRVAAVCVLALGIASCGDGNPFTTTTTSTDNSTTTTTTTTTPTVPEDILNDLTRIDFNATDNTLTVTGLTQDGVPLVNAYTAVATSFVDGFTTFTGQNDGLGRHATAFVASRDGLQAGVVMTGPQFNRFFGGAFFERTGTYTAPTTPDSRFDVTYIGNYAGTLNLPGVNTNLLPTTGVPAAVDTPNQTAYIRGLVFVNVDFNDMSVEGEIYDRVGTFAGVDNGSGTIVVSEESTTLATTRTFPDLVLVSGALAADGSFSGNLELEGSVENDIGDFAGIIGGTDGSSIVGGTTATEFSTTFTNEIEYGVFVADLCTAASTDPICINALSP